MLRQFSMLTRNSLFHHREALQVVPKREAYLNGEAHKPSFFQFRSEFQLLRCPGGKFSDVGYWQLNGDKETLQCLTRKFSKVGVNAALVVDEHSDDTALILKTKPGENVKALLKLITTEDVSIVERPQNRMSPRYS